GGAHERHVPPGVVSGVLIAADDQFRDIVADFDTAAHRTAKRRAAQPQTHPDHSILQAVLGPGGLDDGRRVHGAGGCGGAEKTDRTEKAEHTESTEKASHAKRTSHWDASRACSIRCRAWATSWTP